MKSRPHSWKNLFAKLGLSKRKRRAHCHRFHDRKLHFEQCEDRCMLAVFTVDNLNDGIVTGPGQQPGTLRQAIFDANFSSLGPDTINFQAGLNGTINLDATAGELNILEGVDILGPGAGLITIDAQQNSRVFRIILSASGTNEEIVILDSLTITGGVYACAA